MATAAAALSCARLALVESKTTTDIRFGYGASGRTSASLGHRARIAIPSTTSVWKRGSLPGRRSSPGLKLYSNCERRGGGDGAGAVSRRPKWCCAASAAANTEVAASSPSTTSTLGLEILETLHPNSRVTLSITVPPKVCKDTYNEVIREFSKKSKVPGFRQGKKIPESVLVNYIGPQRVRSSAVEAVLKKTLPEAMASVAGKALKESEHIESKFQDLEASFSSDDAFRYDVAVDVAPEIKWKSENAYKGLKVSVEVDSAPPPQEAADADFTAKLKALGTLRVAPERGLEMGDVAIIDISSKRLNDDGSEGERILSAEQKGFQLDTEDFANFIPGFVGALFNIQREETRSFDLDFPETWQQVNLRGIHARFTATCKEIFVRDLPELDDTLAPRLVEGSSTLDQVKDVLLETHRIKAEQAKKQQIQTALTEELAKVVEIEVPHSLLEEQGRQMYGAKLIEMQTAAKLTKEQVTAFSTEEMVNNFLTSQKDRIKTAVVQTLAVDEIYRLEGLKYSDEELEAEVQAAVEDFKQYNQEYDNERVTEQAKELLEGYKVLDFLMQQSEISYTTKS